MLKEKNLVYDHPLLADCRNVPKGYATGKAHKEPFNKDKLGQFLFFWN